MWTALGAIGWIFILYFLALFVKMPTWVWVVLWLVIVIGMAAADQEKDEAKKKAKEYRKCPSCAEDIRIEAIKCKHCGEAVGARQASV